MITLNEATLDLGKSAKMSEQEIYNLADQFRSVYPDTWETLLTERLMQNKDKAGDKRRILEKRELVHQLEHQLAEVSPASEEKELDKRIAELQKKLDKVNEEEK